MLRHDYYNLLVSAHENEWENETTSFPLSRFLEYTKDSIKSSLDLPTQISQLQTYPTVFAYENGSYYLGRICNVLVKKNEILLTFEILNRQTSNDYSVLIGIDELQIAKFEYTRTHWAVKKCNLLIILSENGLITENELSAFDAISQKNIVVLEDSSKQNENKSPFLCLADIIKYLLENPSNPKYELFYRGHSKVEYELLPSVFRKNKDGHPEYWYSEDKMFKELIIENSADFKEDSCTFDKLVRMQHYSLPTRLLDITSNPLVALYFICSSNLDKNGKLIIISVNKEKIKYFDSDAVSSISNLVRLSAEAKEAIFTEIKKYDLEGRTEKAFNDIHEVQRLYHFIKDEKPFFKDVLIPADLRKIFCVKAKKNNKRIDYQSGAFLLFGIDSILPETMDFEENEENMLVHSIEIPCGLKQSIIKDLDVLNINMASIFQNIESSARYIAQKNFSTF